VLSCLVPFFEVDPKPYSTKLVVLKKIALNFPVYHSLFFLAGQSTTSDAKKLGRKSPQLFLFEIVLGRVAPCL